MMATTRERCPVRKTAQGEEVRERGGGEKNERREHQGRVILAPRHVTPVVADSSGQLHEGTTTGDEASSTAIKVRLVASTRPISLPRARARAHTASSFRPVRNAHAGLYRDSRP